ncbi:hypothetical protein ACSSS7_005728 [Eimeria intestinalis]
MHLQRLGLLFLSAAAAAATPAPCCSYAAIPAAAAAAAAGVGVAAAAAAANCSGSSVYPAATAATTAATATAATAANNQRQQQLSSSIRQPLVVSAVSLPSIKGLIRSSLSLFCYLSCLCTSHQASLFFQEAVAAGAPPRSSALFILNDLQQIFKTWKPHKPIDVKEFASAVRAAESGRLTHKELRVYISALAKGDMDVCKQMLNKEEGQAT